MTRHVGSVLVERIPCPPWCRISQEEHLRDLWDLDGEVIHHSTPQTVTGLTSEVEVEVTSMTFADGTPDPEEGSVVWIGGTELAPEDAETLARTLLEAAQTARAGVMTPPSPHGI